MDEDSFTPEDRAIMDHTDIDVFMSDYRSPPVGRSLEDLPSELIGMIAENLDKESLSILQTLGSRTLLQAIDHALTEAKFSSRRCRTTVTSIKRLDDLSHLRFANRIRALEIYSMLECRSPMSVRYSLSLDTTTTPCIGTTLSESDVRNLFSGIFLRLPNLKSITLCAPPAPKGMADKSCYAHALPIYRVMQALVDAIRFAPQQLEEFRVVGFELRWQTALLGSPKSLFEAIAPALRGLTSLNLELDMATFSANTYMLALVKLIKSNANLRALALSVGAQAIKDYQVRNERWAPLLQLLGGSPPFRLRSLHINGLVTSTTAPTLASIINVHSSTIRRIVLNNTNFHYPNTLRAFFTACANSAISYYETENFYFHERTMIVGRYLADDIVENDDAELHEDVNNNHCDSDAACHGWVKVNWDGFRKKDEWRLVFENEQGQKRRSYMYDTFMNVVDMVKEGSLRDS
ncbi:hypothetical protein J4E93_002919 [Alternaria ventricosa]|uniref:uncharacterized protein n=1 Tax=Alternaria ventricosa TaxID=1187951 RepID=UPI0020C20D5E|nr:uncharacterized protein J4E93_002919 [Alternaria ventricosa]KAI4650563.1 hypothetical protein J4E93_002919 [Alternaria ventricosa]